MGLSLPLIPPSELFVNLIKALSSLFIHYSINIKAIIPEPGQRTCSPSFNTPENGHQARL
jgi:hypothetical protein